MTSHSKLSQRGKVAKQITKNEGMKLKRIQYFTKQDRTCQKRIGGN